MIWNSISGLPSGRRCGPPAACVGAIRGVKNLDFPIHDARITNDCHGLADPLAPQYTNCSAPLQSHVSTSICTYCLPRRWPQPLDLVANMEIHNKDVKHAEELADRKYIRFDSGVEQIPPNEAENIEAVAAQINAIQKAMYNNARHCYTGAYRAIEPILRSRWRTLIIYRHPCENTRCRKGQAHRIGRPTQAPEAEHVCESRRVPRHLSIQQRASRSRPRRNVTTTPN